MNPNHRYEYFDAEEEQEAQAKIQMIEEEEKALQAAFLRASNKTLWREYSNR